MLRAAPSCAVSSCIPAWKLCRSNIDPTQRRPQTWYRLSSFTWSDPPISHYDIPIWHSFSGILRYLDVSAKKSWGSIGPICWNCFWHIFCRSIWHTSDVLSGISCSILSGIFSGVLFGAPSDTLHFIWHLSPTLSCILPGVLSGILSRILSIWLVFWRSTSRTSWHSVWHLFWHVFGSASALIRSSKIWEPSVLHSFTPSKKIEQNQHAIWQPGLKKTHANFSGLFIHFPVASASGGMLIIDNLSTDSFAMWKLGVQLRHMVPNTSKYPDAGCNTFFLSQALGETGQTHTRVEQLPDQSFLPHETNWKCQGEKPEQKQHGFVGFCWYLEATTAIVKDNLFDVWLAKR